MFLTPIFYPVTMIPERVRPFVWLNPMAILVSMFRNVVMDGTMPALWKLAAFLLCAVTVFWCGLVLFNKTKWEFADVI
jgi:lipopolysaccharide transport system permease protein